MKTEWTFIYEAWGWGYLTETSDTQVNMSESFSGLDTYKDIYQLGVF